MGRIAKGRHDLDDEFTDIELDFDDADGSDTKDRLEALFIDLEDRPALRKRTRKKGERKRATKAPVKINNESDDWRDPQDDIMYGFKG